MEIEKQLKETLELTEYQILIYLSLLEKTGTAGQLFRRLNMNRATLYRVLDELVLLNLVIKKQTGKRMFFEAMHPDSLLDAFEKRKIGLQEKGLMLQRVVNELISKARSKPIDASITIEKGISAHYRYMKLQLTCKEKLVRQKISSESSIYSYTKYPEGGDYETFLKKFMKDFYDNGIYIKSLVSNALSGKMKEYNKSNFEEHRDVRILPEEILPNVSFKVFDDYSCFTIRDGNPEDMTIITIRNAVTAALLKSFFDFIFDRSIIQYNALPLPTVLTKEHEKLSAIGMGTAGVGGYWDRMNPYANDTSDLDQMRHAISRGIHYIDTCLLYAEGHSVELVGRAIRNIPRSELFINAKITRPGGKLVSSPNEVIEQCDRYLKLMKVDYVDQLQIHSKSSLAIPEEEVVQKIGELITAGKVRYWGVGNYKKDDLIRVQTYIKEPLFGNEIPYGVYARDYEKNGTIAYMRENNILTIAYFVVRNGGMRVDEFDESKLLVALGKKYGKKASQVSVNWAVHHPLTIALIKSTNGTHINENVGSVGWEMSEADYQAIEQLETV
jgi:diketogulonate reductase-like aldo/keto reductase/sugar-specific transcriptional regulator TrmB